MIDILHKLADPTVSDSEWRVEAAEEIAGLRTRVEGLQKELQTSIAGEMQKEWDVRKLRRKLERAEADHADGLLNP